MTEETQTIQGEENESEIDQEQELSFEERFELCDRKDFVKGGKIDHNPMDDIKWVFHALGVADLKPKDAPSPGAWLMLCSLREDEIALKQFYTSVYPKLLPTKAQMEKGDPRAEDGRKQFVLIEQLLSEPDIDAPVLSDTERRARELAVSRKSA